MIIKEKATRFTICIILVVTLACSLFVPAFAATAYKLGDVNRDGDITMSDVVELQRTIAHLVEFDDEQKVLGDVTGDGNLKMDDVVAIQKYIAKLIPSFGDLSSDSDTPVNTDTDTPGNTDSDTPGNTDTDINLPIDTDTDTESDDEDNWTDYVYKP